MNPTSITIENQFLAAYDANHDAIFRLVFFQTRDRNVALDLTQETFTRVWVYLQGGKTVDNLRAFLFQSARNAVIDYRRKKKSDSLDAMYEAGFEPANSDHEKILTQFDAKDLADTLELLDAPYREVVTLRYLSELTISEIAATIGESENNVSVRLHRGIAKLKDLYHTRYGTN